MRERSPIAIGLASIAFLAVAVFGAFMAGFMHVFERTYAVSAIVADGAGIRGGDDVRLAGVKVGRVAAVEARPGHNDVLLALRIDRGVQLGPQTTAAVSLQGLLGARFVRLGGDVHPPYLASGAVIPLDRTSTPFDTFDITSATQRATSGLDTKALNKLVTELAAVTGGKREDVARLVDGIDRVARAVADRDSELRSLLDRAHVLSGTLAEKDAVVQRLVDQASGLLAVLDEHRGDLASALSGTDTLTGEIASLLKVHKAQLESILATLHPIAEILDKRQKDLDQALSFIGPGVMGLTRPATHGPWVDLYVRALGPDVIQAIEDLAKVVHK
jgi:phospholipid/cholesterol/gamma-HCH transport system substrate-binding protein